ncbi:heavy-metal-associated domain-containing protein [Oceanobacillus bengalensis]|uniref:Copper chaperone CopZ n=1 Tax=Oceanobacillus bengalensis TaxID=1435466 RepID=A0A494Z865_9BACI|nr:heavy metal-associated domain-containing protein [Oceanobacillus bengalensis]RKQ18548.1 heavy-metal-associated domain-containing protein [Oceanobacillus bengalensis]
MKEMVYLDIKGMHCPNCPKKVEKSVSKLGGVCHVNVDYETEKASVTFVKELTSITDIIKRINKMGFEAETSKVVQ